MKKEMKMWCLCRKKDGKPIKLDIVNNNKDLLNVVGFATKKDLMLAAFDVEENEEVYRITFEY